MTDELFHYASLLDEIKDRIRRAQSGRSIGKSPHVGAVLGNWRFHRVAATS